MERRLAARYAQEIDIELHQREQRVRMRTVDVSKHGLFVACDNPPADVRAVMLTVKLNGGPLSLMTHVVRRVSLRRDGVLGLGMKLFCMGAEAKDRWDRFIWSLAHPALAYPTRATSTAAACFLIQPDDASQLEGVLRENIEGKRVMQLSPAVRRLGAEIQVVLVHPVSHEELAFTARVVELNPDHPQRMGIRFDDVGRVQKRELTRMLGIGDDVHDHAGASSSEGAPVLEGGERSASTEYAYFSPKLAARVPDEPLAVVTGQLLEPPAPFELSAPAGSVRASEPLIDAELSEQRALFDFSWVNDDVSEE